jgi:hypothetical protein
VAPVRLRSYTATTRSKVPEKPGRTATLAPITVVTNYRYLSAIFRSAVADRKLAISPCQQIELPKVEKMPSSR